MGAFADQYWDNFYSCENLNWSQTDDRVHSLIMKRSLLLNDKSHTWYNTLLTILIPHLWLGLKGIDNWTTPDRQALECFLNLDWQIYISFHFLTPKAWQLFSSSLIYSWQQIIYFSIFCSNFPFILQILKYISNI